MIALQLVVTMEATDVVMVVEVVSPNSSFRTDTVDKKAAYAAAGIPVYLIIFLNETGEGVAHIEEYQLADGRYHLVRLHTRRLALDEPIPVEVAFSDLNSG